MEKSSKTLSVSNDKKANVTYWDDIDNIACDCVTGIAAMSTKPVELDCFDITDIYKEVVELITHRLETDFGCEFPYVEGNF